MNEGLNGGVACYVFGLKLASQTPSLISRSGTYTLRMYEVHAIAFKVPAYMHPLTRNSYCSATASRALLPCPLDMHTYSYVLRRPYGYIHAVGTDGVLVTGRGRRSLYGYE